MNKYKAILAGVALLAVPALCSATIVYEQDFEGVTPPETDSWYSFSGPAHFTNSVWEVQAYGGSQALVFEGNGSGVVNNEWYWYAGIGRSDIVAAPVGQTPANMTLSIDLATMGANNTTPIELSVAQYDGVNPNATWSTKWTPTLTTDGSFTTVNVAMDSGTETGTYNPAYNLSMSVTFNNNGFGLDDGNQVIVDNVSLDVIPEPATLGLIGFAGAGVLFVRRRFRI